jgi:predicted Zn-dependent peptidase
LNSTLATAVFVAVSMAAVTGQAPDRRPKPGADTPPVWAPVILKHRLSNGLPVWIVEQHELPLVQMSLLVRTGTAADPPGRFGIASLTSALLSEGAGARSAAELADELDAQVANLSASATADTSSVRLYAPVAALGAVLPLMADMAMRPTFPAPALDRARRQRLGMLRGVRDDPDAIAALALARGLYGSADRNAAPQIGAASSLAATTVEDVARFHKSAYRPANSTLLVVGAVTPADVLPLLETHFGRWQSPETDDTVRASTPEIRRPARQLLLADLPNAPQSRILVGGVSATSPTSDYFPIQVLNAVLRGRFGSARTPTLRGNTTGVRSAFDRRRSAGPLVLATAAEGDKTAEALTEMLGELASILTAIPADELARVKGEVALEFSRTFEATGRISSRLQALETLVAFDLPDDYYSTYAPAIQAVSSDDVQRVARQYLQPEHLVIAIAGDRKSIEPRLRALGIEPPTLVAIDELFAAPK